MTRARVRWCGVSGGGGKSRGEGEVAVIVRASGRSRCYGEKRRRGVDILGRRDHAREPPMSQSFDASKSLTAFEQDSTLVAVIEMSQSKWLVAAVVPGIARQPLKKLDADAGALL